MRPPRSCNAVVALLMLLLTIASTPARALDLFSGLFTPDNPFDTTEAPESPDYANPQQWAALPDRKDNAEPVPKGANLEDRQAQAVAER